MNKIPPTVLLLCLFPMLTFAQAFRPLFDGETLEGWEGDLDYFRAEDGILKSGRTDQDIPHNFFLCTLERYDNFEITLEARMNGRRNNGGIQIRTERVPDHHEVSGYQCDIGEWPPQDTKLVWGAIYDENRRNKYLVPAREDAASFAHVTDWNDYRILADGPRIQIWVNDERTADFTETDHIPGTGRICVQIHGGPAAEVWHRNFVIKELD